MNNNQFDSVCISVTRNIFCQINRRNWFLVALACCLLFASESKAGLKIFYIRHAEGGHNVVGEWKDVPKAQWPAYVGNMNVFTPKGETQVMAATEKLQKYHFDFIAVSPAWRTRHTILPYLKAMNVKGVIWPELNEYSSDISMVLSTNLPPPADKTLNAGALIQLPPDEATYFQLPDDKKREFKSRPLQDGPAHNADIRFVLQNAIARIHKLFGGTEKSILLVGHGNSGRDLLELLINDPLKNASWIANTGLWMVEEQPDGHFKLEVYNDAPYKSSGVSVP